MRVHKCVRLSAVPAAIALAACFSACSAVGAIFEWPPDDQPPDAASASIIFPENETFWDLIFTAQLGEGYSMPINYWGNGKGVYYYFLPSGCGPESVTIRTLHGITMRKDGTDKPVLSLKNGDTFAGVECNAQYMLGCYDINNYHYETPVVFMQGENIPAMFITTQSGSMDAVYQDKSYKEKGDMLLVDAGRAVEYDGRLTYIKGRGNGSWWSAKKPFNIKLAQKTDLFGMGASREWSLLGQDTDMSCLRNKISYDIAKASGMAYSPDSEFVDLWIDGDYYGLYLLTDRINISEGSVNITDLESATEAVNLDKLSTYAQVEDEKRDGRYFAISNNPPDITGGYLIELDKFYSSDKATRFATDRVSYITLKSPEYATKEQFDYIRSLILRMEKAIVNKSSQAYTRYIDSESWAKMCVIQEVLANSDFMGSSQYFYKEADKDGKTSLIYAAPIWDMDLSLGNDINSIRTNVLTITSRSWVKHLYSRKAFKALMVSEYEQTYRPLFMELLQSGIDENASRIQASAAMNFTRWPHEKQAAGHEDLFADSVKYLKEYLGERLAFFDALWLDGENFRTVQVTTDTRVDSSYYYMLDYLVRSGEPLGDLGSVDKTGYIFTGWYYGYPSRPGAPYEPDAPVTRDGIVHAKYVNLLTSSPETLEEMGYRLDRCEDLDVYLRLLDKDDYTVFMAVSGRGGQLYASVLEEFAKIGNTVNLNDIKLESYYAVIDKGELIAEEHAPGVALERSGQLSDGTAYTIKSACQTEQDGATLLINGQNIFVDGRGLNIAVFDNSSGKPVLLDSVCFNLQYDSIASRKSAKTDGSGDMGAN